MTAGQSTIDFSTKSDSDLDYAISKIDREKFPANFTACQAEIEKRKQEGRWSPERSIASGSDIGILPFVASVLSFVPGIGLIFAAFSVIYGWIHRREGGRPLIVIGVLGSMVSFSIYGYLYSRLYSWIGTPEHHSQQLMLVAHLIERHKEKKGFYPSTIKDIPLIPIESDEWDHIHYEVAPNGKFYYLLGKGNDGLPFTSDDITPMQATNAESPGYRREKF